jgi:hypothetical protein
MWSTERQNLSPHLIAVEMNDGHSFAAFRRHVHVLDIFFAGQG